MSACDVCPHLFIPDSLRVPYGEDIDGGRMHVDVFFRYLAVAVLGWKVIHDTCFHSPKVSQMSKDGTMVMARQKGQRLVLEARDKLATGQA